MPRSPSSTRGSVSADRGSWTSCHCRASAATGFCRPTPIGCSCQYRRPTVSWRSIRRAGRVADSQNVPHPTRLVLQEDGHFLWVATRNTGRVGGRRRARGGHAASRGAHRNRHRPSRHRAGPRRPAGVRHQPEIGDIDGNRRPPPGRSSANCASAPTRLRSRSRRPAARPMLWMPMAARSPSWRAIRRPSVNRLAVGPGASSIGFAPGGGSGSSPGLRRTRSSQSMPPLTGSRGEWRPRLCPDQVAFTDHIAYVRQAGSPMLRLLPIDGLTSPTQLPSAIDVPIGRSAPGNAPSPGAAAAIARASAEDAMLIANHADQAIYYYKEGTVGPTRQFSRLRARAGRGRWLSTAACGRSSRECTRPSRGCVGRGGSTWPYFSTALRSSIASRSRSPTIRGVRPVRPLIEAHLVEAPSNRSSAGHPGSG